MGEDIADNVINTDGNQYKDSASNPNFKSARDVGMVKVDIVKAPPLIDMADDEFIKRYSGPLILGPFVPAIFALITIFYGQIVIKTWTGTCGYSLDVFIAAAVGVSYLFLIVYMWIFIGTELKLTLPVIGTLRVIGPFKDLMSLVWIWSVISITSFIVWIIGTGLLNLSSFCQATAPDLYNFSLFLVVTYWIGFCVVVLYFIKIVFGKTLEKAVREKIRAPNVNEAAENMFKSKYMKYDPNIGERQIPRKFLKPLLKDIGVYIPAEEQETLMNTFDPDDSGMLQYSLMLSWFRELNENIDDDDLGSDDSDGPMDVEVMAIEKAEKEKRMPAKKK
jgi:Ca2+-binding EF-hand superfamily protein